MEINFINLILNKENISQKKLAKQLKGGVKESTLSSWKNGKEPIPKKRKIELRKRALKGTLDESHSQKWLAITHNSKKIEDQWYINFAEHIPYSIWKNDDQYGDIDYDSIWIYHIQKILVTLYDAGIPVINFAPNFPGETVKPEHFIFNATRDPIFDESLDYAAYADSNPIGWETTIVDELLIHIIKEYLAIRNWAMWNILDINDKRITQLQFDLALHATEIALYKIPRDLLVGVATNMSTYDEFKKKSRSKAFSLITHFIVNVKNFSLIDEDLDTKFFFRYINETAKTLKEDILENPKYIEKHGKQDNKKSDLEISADEKHQETLDRLENLENLLIEMKEQLNNITNTGESK